MERTFKSFRRIADVLSAKGEVCERNPRGARRGGLALGDAMRGAGPTTYVRRAILRETSATGTALNGSGGGFAVVGAPGSATSLYMDHTTFLGNSANSATRHATCTDSGVRRPLLALR